MPMQDAFVPPSTAAELLNAKLDELKHWAREINKESLRLSGTKPIKSLSLHKDALLQALATYLKIDLSASAAGQPSGDELDVKPSVSAADRALTLQQYDFWLSLGNKWANEEPYHFSSDDIPGPLHEDNDASRAANALHTTPAPAITSQPAVHPVPIPFIAQSSSQISQAINMEVSSVNKVSGLLEAVQQGVAGDLDRMAEQEKMRHSNAYNSVKNTLSRRRKVYAIYMHDFNSDLDRFAAFFRGYHAPSVGRGGFHSKDKDGLLSLNEVADHMINLCRQTIAREKAKVSQAEWDRMWEGKNRFEIMEIIWKCRIEKEKADEKYIEDGKFSQQKWDRAFPKDHWYYIGKDLYTKKD